MAAPRVWVYEPMSMGHMCFHLKADAPLQRPYGHRLATTIHKYHRWFPVSLSIMFHVPWDEHPQMARVVETYIEHVYWTCWKRPADQQITSELRAIAAMAAMTHTSYALQPSVATEPSSRASNGPRRPLAPVHLQGRRGVAGVLLSCSLPLVRARKLSQSESLISRFQDVFNYMSMYLNICHGACVIWQPTKWGELLQLQYDNWRFVNSVFKLCFWPLPWIGPCIWIIQSGSLRIKPSYITRKHQNSIEFITKSKKHHRHS